MFDDTEGRLVNIQKERHIGEHVEEHVEEQVSNVGKLLVKDKRGVAKEKEK